MIVRWLGSLLLPLSCALLFVACSGDEGAGVPVAPSITREPDSVIAAPGASVTLSVQASGSGPLAYQWRKEGVPIEGATASSLTIAVLLPADAGRYDVVVDNAAGSATSSTVTVAMVTALTLPQILVAPASASVVAGQPVTLAVQVESVPPVSYQWRKDGSALEGATGASVTLAETTSSDAGSYEVVVSNGAGAVVSATATVTVLAAEGD